MSVDEHLMESGVNLSDVTTMQVRKSMLLKLRVIAYMQGNKVPMKALEHLVKSYEASLSKVNKAEYLMVYYETLIWERQKQLKNAPAEKQDKLNREIEIIQTKMELLKGGLDELYEDEKKDGEMDKLLHAHREAQQWERRGAESKPLTLDDVPEEVVTVDDLKRDELLKDVVEEPALQRPNFSKHYGTFKEMTGVDRPQRKSAELKQRIKKKCERILGEPEPSDEESEDEI